MKSRRDFNDCSIICFSETWLDGKTPENALCPEGYTPYRGDRDNNLSGKKGGGGVCILVNQRWCTDSKEINKSCSPDLETLTVQCRPFYSPREFSSVIIVSMCVPCSANKRLAARAISDHVFELESQFPDSFVVILGDFNHTNIKKVLPKFYQQVLCATREQAILDQCYCKIKNAFRSFARAPLGKSDHAIIQLVPSYKQKIKQYKPKVIEVKKWTTEAIDSLRAEFDCTLWDELRDSCDTIDEYTELVTSYIAFCENKCIPKKSVKIYANNKPWFTQNLAELRKVKTKAYLSGDKQAYKRAKVVFEKEVKNAKFQYKDKIERKFESGDARSVWQGLEQMTDYKRKSVDIDADPSLPDKLNTFYSRFDPNAQPIAPSSQVTDGLVSTPSLLSTFNTTSSQGAVPTPLAKPTLADANLPLIPNSLLSPVLPMPTISSPNRASLISPSPPITNHPYPGSLVAVTPPLPSTPLTVNYNDVKKLFKLQNCRKAAGPDNISAATIKHCADQLAIVFTDIFNLSLQQGIVPKCFKTSTIIPIPKKTKITCLNDYRPVALMSIVMKIFERLVLRYLKTQTDALVDPGQLAYRAN